MRVMFMLVGDQTVPNLIPYLELNAQSVISDVVLVTTRAAPLEHALKNLTNFLTQSAKRPKPAIHRCEVEKLDLQENLIVGREIVQDLRKKASERGDSECKFIFNMTSGTKIMALAAYQLAIETSSRLVYLDSDRNQLLDLLPELQPHPLTQVLNIVDYVTAYGYKIRGQEFSGQTIVPSTTARQAAEILAKAPSSTVGRLLKRLVSTGGSSQPEWIDFENSYKAELELSLALNGSLWQLNAEETIVTERSRFKIDWLQPANFFPGGKWLELYAFDCASRLLQPNGKLHDSGAGVTLVHYQGFENELDVVFSWGHHLAICSCKTGTKANSQWIYDLNDRARSLGTFCHRLLLLNFDTHLARDFRERAHRDKIHLFDQTDLPDLTNRFAQLIIQYK